MGSIKNKLASKLLFVLILFSFGIMIIMGLVEYKMIINRNMKLMENSYNFIKDSAIKAVIVPLYNIDYPLLDVQLKVLLTLDYIEYIEVIDQNYERSNRIAVGDSSYKTDHFRSIELVYIDSEGESLYLGDMIIYYSISIIKRSAIHDTLINIIPKFLFVLIINILFFTIIQNLIIKHLVSITNYTKKLDLKNNVLDLSLDRVESNDELSAVVDSINVMKNRIYDDFKAIRDIERELNISNRSLTEKVESQGVELDNVVTSLKLTQNKLVESEKLSALKGLIAGITHEINNPLGISITGITFLEDLNRIFLEKYSNNTMKKSDLNEYLLEVSELTLSLHHNIKRAVDLVGNLKKVSSDQTSEERRIFNVNDYINDILVTLRAKLKRTKHTINVDCPVDIVINSIPGALGQVIINLVLNSLLHGFEEVEAGVITIIISEEADNIIFTYRDNGNGIKKEIKEHVFEPFFTTKKGLGGTGLGLQIVYNIITKTLNGYLELISEEDKGVEFIMSIPK